MQAARIQKPNRKQMNAGQRRNSRGKKKKIRKQTVVISYSIYCKTRQELISKPRMTSTGNEGEGERNRGWDISGI